MTDDNNIARIPPLTVIVSEITPQRKNRADFVPNIPEVLILNFSPSPPLGPTVLVPSFTHLVLHSPTRTASEFDPAD